jgi:hypothetical protein
VIDDLVSEHYSIQQLSIQTNEIESLRRVVLGKRRLSHNGGCGAGGRALTHAK